MAAGNANFFDQTGSGINQIQNGVPNRKRK